mmetsp:Transcript_5057/g.11033  ORF Transcript_5057/g.11033 Transcript_5057/m.11033 type:complete len:265 (-) Transcript_5057:812-1606(-)
MENAKIAIDYVRKLDESVAEVVEKTREAVGLFKAKRDDQREDKTVYVLRPTERVQPEDIERYHGIHFEVGASGHFLAVRTTKRRAAKLEADTERVAVIIPADDDDEEERRRKEGEEGEEAARNAPRSSSALGRQRIHDLMMKYSTGRSSAAVRSPPPSRPLPRIQPPGEGEGDLLAPPAPPRLKGGENRGGAGRPAVAVGGGEKKRPQSCPVHPTSPPSARPSSRCGVEYDAKRRRYEAYLIIRPPSTPSLPPSSTAKGRREWG